MAKTWKKLTVVEEFVDFRNSSRNTTEVFPRNLSTAQAIEQTLLGYIERNELKYLREGLTSDFIYSAKNWVYKEQYQGNNHTRTWKKQYFLIRPVAEALLFEHLSVFHHVLIALKDKSEELKKAFIDGCLSNNDIPKDIFNPLDASTIQALNKEIETLKQHDPKHQTAQALATELEKLLQSRPAVSASPIDQLEFKIGFVEKIHSKDAILARDLNYKKTFVNMAMLLLGFIPNVIHWALTGNFLFFKNTTQQACVARMNKQFHAILPPREKGKDLPEPDMPYEPPPHSPSILTPSGWITGV